MTDKAHHEAAKQVLAEEFGIEGIDDPAEVRCLVALKMAGMNVLDRAALMMRLGSAVQSAEAGGEPSWTVRLAVSTVFIVLAWFLWRPLTGVFAIFDLANMRHFAIRHSPFWSPAGALVVGGVYGLLIGFTVMLSVVFTVRGWFGTVALGLLGFMGAGYIGHGVHPDPLFRMPGEEKRVAAQVAAVLVYALSLIVFWGGRALLSRS
jgi:hypothetical protein